jgi:trigger factor
MSVTVENVAACKKKLTITIPAEDVKAKINEKYRELEHDAQVPGFRPGHAPRRLIEKRFHEAVRDEVRAKLISEALEAAFKDEKLDVIGEPDLDPAKIEMPEDGPLVFSIELEVRPEFTLPDYVGIPISVAQPTVTEENIAAALDRLREQNGKLDLLPADAEAKENDLITGDITLQAGDALVLDRTNVRLPVAAIAIEGIRLENIPAMLKGAQAGETKTATITIGQEAEKEDLRGKSAEVRIKVAELRRVALPDDATLLKAVDYEDMESLKGAIRRQLDAQTDQACRRAQETAVQNWLLEKAPMELPDELAKRHAAGLLQRHVVDLQYRGVPVEEIEKHVSDMKSASTEQAARDLKLFFILDAIAKKETIEVTDAEVDARLRYMAAQSHQREDRLHERMEADGTLDNLRSQIRDDKVLRLLLEKAQITTPAPVEPKVEEKPAAKAEEKPEPKAEEKPEAKAEEKPAAKAEEKSEAEKAPKPKAEEKPEAEKAPKPKAEKKPKAKGVKKPAAPKTPEASGDVQST